jgi:hypothetical protein
MSIFKSDWFIHKPTDEYIAKLTSLLNDIKASTGKNCFIAGGAIRDWCLNKPVRDIDLYVANGSFYAVMELLTGSRQEYKAFGGDDPAYQHQYIDAQCEFELDTRRLRFEWPLDMPTRINLIQVQQDIIVNFSHGQGIETILSAFNFGICRIALSPSGEVWKHKSFTRDAIDQKITLYREDWGVERSILHFWKLHTKYGWPLRFLVEGTELVAGKDNSLIVKRPGDTDDDLL